MPVASDLTAAARGLRSDRSFSIVVVLTIAVAIGANTAIFSVFDQLVLHPVSIPDPPSLVAIWFNNPQRNVQTPSTSIPRYKELRASTQSFSAIGISAFDSFTLTGNGEATQLIGLRVSASFLSTLGIAPLVGRNFSDQEDVPNGPRVCIVSHELWQSQLGRRDGLIGQTIQLNGVPWEVVGIMPPKVSAPFTPVQIYALRVFEVSGLTATQVDSGATYAQAIARLKPDRTIEQARAELVAFSAGYKERHPTNLDATNISEPRSFVRALVSNFEPTMYTLLAAVATVLVIACANIASLFLSRMLRRRREIAVRLSLGATRGAIVRQFLVESLLFSSVAGLLGVLFAIGSLAALQPVVALQLPPNTPLELRWQALVFAIAVTGTTALLIGIVPAIQASNTESMEWLKDSARGTSSTKGRRFRQMLIVAEVTLSVVLLVGAGLLIASFVNLTKTELGFDPGGSAAAFVGLSTERYATPAQQTDFFERAIANLRAQPGVVDAAAAFVVPLGGISRTPYALADQPPPPLGQRPIVGMNVVSDGYFKLLAIPLLQGRAFNADDRPTSPAVCIVNEAFARKISPGQSAIGRELLFGANRRVAVVGVARDVKTVGPSAPAPEEAYFPLRQLPRPNLNLIARTTMNPASMQAAVKSAVAAVDSTQAISFFATLDSNVAASLGNQQLAAMLTGAFAALALGLSLTGLYSVLAYLVSQRTAEIGIRMALGATRRQVIAMVMRSGLGLVAVGLAIGLAGAAGAVRLINTLLVGVSPLNPPLYVAVVAVFGFVAALACLGPSLRAARIDPLVAFRSE